MYYLLCKIHLYNYIKYSHVHLINRCLLKRNKTKPGNETAAFFSKNQKLPHTTP